MKIFIDLLFIIGYLSVIVPTFFLNLFVGFYLLGASLLYFSITISLMGREKPPKTG